MRHLHLEITILSLCAIGLWPLQFNNKLYRKAYRVYHFILIMIAITCVLSQYAELFTMKTNLLGMTNILTLTVLFTRALVKVYVIWTTRVRKLIAIIQVTEKGVQKEVGHVYDIYKIYAAKSRMANKLAIFLGLSCYLIFMITPIVIELVNPLKEYYVIIGNAIVYKERPLPFASWYPFDRFKYYWYSFAWQALSCYVCVCFVVATDNLFYALMNFAVGQIKILQYSLVTLINEKLLIEKLSKTIHYHNAIIWYVKMLDASMKGFLLLDFAASSIQIAIICFQIAAGDISMELLKSVYHLGALLTQVFLFYWFGNEVLLESARVAKSVWECQWYELNRSAKTTLLQIMVRSQKPLHLSVGVFYEMSTATMVIILRASYSYAAIMCQFYSRRLKRENA